MVAPKIHKVQPIQPFIRLSFMAKQKGTDTHKEGQALFEEEMRHDGADNDGESSHWCHKDSFGESAVQQSAPASDPFQRDKGVVTHYATKFRISPMTIIVIPVHHIQLFRYPKPSPAEFPYLLVAANKPFFFTTKLRFKISKGIES